MNTEQKIIFDAKHQKILIIVLNKEIKDFLVKCFFCAPHSIRYKLYLYYRYYYKKNDIRYFETFKQRYKYLQIGVSKKGLITHNRYSFEKGYYIKRYLKDYENI